MQPINVKRTFKKNLDISKLNTSYTCYKPILKDKKGSTSTARWVINIEITHVLEIQARALSSLFWETTRINTHVRPHDVLTPRKSGSPTLNEKNQTGVHI